MVNMTSNFTSSLILLQLFKDNFGLSEEESSGEEAEGTYTYLGSQVVDPDAMAVLRSTVATDNLARSWQSS